MDTLLGWSKYLHECTKHNHVTMVPLCFSQCHSFHSIKQRVDPGKISLTQLTHTLSLDCDPSCVSLFKIPLQKYPEHKRNQIQTFLAIVQGYVVNFVLVLGSKAKSRRLHILTEICHHKLPRNQLQWMPWICTRSWGLAWRSLSRKTNCQG